MFDPNKYEEIAKKLFSALPSSLQNFEMDIQQKFKEVLQMSFAHLNLVTREEFDVQAKVLIRTREKLEALQKQVDTLMNDKL
ncbi:MAG: accessory factor UbiK family protein [Legionella sp.]|nr:accessory factor UbiK family protein [Legionella sp.]